jgi:hypothetical protein
LFTHLRLGLPTTYFLESNAVFPWWSSPTFWRKILLPSSRSTSKASYFSLLVVWLILWPKNGG